MHPAFHRRFRKRLKRYARHSEGVSRKGQSHLRRTQNALVVLFREPTAGLLCWSMGGYGQATRDSPKIERTRKMGSRAIQVRLIF